MVLALTYIQSRLFFLGIIFLYACLTMLNHLMIIQWMPPCLIKWLTGFSCFACGTNRSIMLLLKGDFMLSFQMNPLGIVTVLGITLLLIMDFILFKQKHLLHYGAH